MLLMREEQAVCKNRRLDDLNCGEDIACSQKIQVHFKKRQRQRTKTNKYQQNKINVYINSIHASRNYQWWASIIRAYTSHVTYPGSLITHPQMLTREPIKRQDGELSKITSIQTRIKIYMSLAVSTAIYDCETWKSTARIIYQLSMFRRRCLRKIKKIYWKGTYT